MIAAFDIGSGSTRLGLVDNEGYLQQVWRCNEPLPIVYLAGGRTALDLPALRSRVADLLQQCSDHCEKNGITVTALTCTAVRYATVLTTADGTTVSWANVDRSATQDRSDWALSEQESARRGGVANPLSLHSRVLSEPGRKALAEKQWLAMPLHAWVLSGLGAEPFYDRASALDTRMLDTYTQDWAERPERLSFARLVDAGEPVGYLQSVLGAGNLVGTVLFASGGDTAAAVSALNGLRAGDVVMVAGTTTPVAVVSPGLAITPSKEVHWSMYSRPAQWLAERNAGRTGAGLEWLINAIGSSFSEISTLDYGDQPENSVRFYAGTSLSSPAEHGMVPVRGGTLFNDVTSYPTRQHLLDAAVDSNAWAASFQAERIAQATGMTLQRVIVCGGQGRSQRFLERVAEATKCPVYAVTEEVTLIGAAIGAKSTGPGGDATLRFTDRQSVSPGEDTEGQYRKWVDGWYLIQGQTQRNGS